VVCGRDWRLTGVGVCISWAESRDRVDWGCKDKLVLDRHTSDFCGNDLVTGTTIAAGQGRIGVVGDFVWHGGGDGLGKSSSRKRQEELNERSWGVDN
jgi:hypothetical protein